MTTKLNTWWFVLGHEPWLSLAEIFATLTSAKFTTSLPWSLLAPDSIYPPVVSIKCSLRPEKFILELGGTVKIGQEIGRDFTEHQLVEALLNELRKVDGKIHFGISFYAEETREKAANQIEIWGMNLKKTLKDDGRSVRYVFPTKYRSDADGKNRSILSSVTVSKNGLNKRGREFLVVKTKTGFAVAKTVAVQPFEEFSKRDYGRPGRDDKSGMLPPKLALMLINIAGGSKNGVLLDPFCGSGTILTEALQLGFHTIWGSDIAERAIIDSQRNIAWTKNNMANEAILSEVTLRTSEALNLSEQFPAFSVDTIVTEPYLGPPLRGSEFPNHVKTACAELGNLYTQTFAEFKKILKSGGAVVFIIPRFFINKTWYTISNAILPEIKRLGFHPERLLPPELYKEYYLLYHRPQQFVGREVWRFRRE